MTVKCAVIYTYDVEHLSDCAFQAAQAPVTWEPVDVTPVKGRDGIFRIPQRCIDLIHETHVRILNNTYTHHAYLTYTHFIHTGVSLSFVKIVEL